MEPCRFGRVCYLIVHSPNAVPDVDECKGFTGLQTGFTDFYNSLRLCVEIAERFEQLENPRHSKYTLLDILHPGLPTITLLQIVLKVASVSENERYLLLPALLC